MVFLTNIDLELAAQKYGIPLNGVYSKDQLPQLSSGGYIINMENSHDSYGNKLDGSHWVSLWVEPDKNGNPKSVCYFDSFGLAPPWDVQKTLKSFVPYRYNKVQIQSVESGICGYYAIFFIWYMGQKRASYPNLSKRFDKFLTEFNLKNPHKNRERLDTLLKKYFK